MTKTIGWPYLCIDTGIKTRQFWFTKANSWCVVNRLRVGRVCFVWNIRRHIKYLTGK